MNNDRKSFGFKDQETIWDIYLGKFVCACHNHGDSVYGILKVINSNDNYADFMPSIVGRGDGSLAVNTELPTRISLPIHLIRPITQAIGEYVEGYNKRSKTSIETETKTP
jgi:hypothetical protein